MFKNKHEIQKGKFELEDRVVVVQTYNTSLRGFAIVGDKGKIVRVDLADERPWLVEFDNGRIAWAKDGELRKLTDRKATKERVYHTAETKQKALKAWRDSPTRPKAAIAREFGIAQATFNMWTLEEPKNSEPHVVYSAPRMMGKTTVSQNELMFMQVKELRRIADALERRV